MSAETTSLSRSRNDTESWREALAHWSAKAGRSTAWGLLGVGLLFAAWLGFALWRGNPLLLPTPAQVLDGLAALTSSGVLFGDLLNSLRRVFVGFFLAAGLAVPLGLVLSYSQRLGAIFVPVVTLLRPIPPIAWIPLAILWFGLSEGSSYYITTVAAFFPIFLSVYGGGLAVERQHIRAAESLGAKRFVILTRVFLPSAAPSILTGLRIGLGQAWMAVVTAELVAAQSGLGYRIQLSRLNLETAEVIACMVVIGVLGAAMTSALGWAEERLLPWQVTRKS